MWLCDSAACSVSVLPLRALRRTVIFQKSCSVDITEGVFMHMHLLVHIYACMHTHTHTESSRCQHGKISGVCINFQQTAFWKEFFNVHWKYKVVLHKWGSKWVLINIRSPQTKRSVRKSTSIWQEEGLLLWLLVIPLLAEAFFRPLTSTWVCPSNTLPLLLMFFRLLPSIVLVVPQTCAHLQHPCTPCHCNSLLLHIFLILPCSGRPSLPCAALSEVTLPSSWWMTDGWPVTFCYFGGTQCPWWRICHSPENNLIGLKSEQATGVNLSGCFAPILIAI